MLPVWPMRDPEAYAGWVRMMGSPKWLRVCSACDEHDCHAKLNLYLEHSANAARNKGQKPPKLSSVVLVKGQKPTAES